MTLPAFDSRYLVDFHALEARRSPFVPVAGEGEEE